MPASLLQYPFAVEKVNATDETLKESMVQEQWRASGGKILPRSSSAGIT
jgi:hypothetical protein